MDEMSNVADYLKPNKKSSLQSYLDNILTNAVKEFDIVLNPLEGQDVGASKIYMDVFETNDKFICELELPGVPKDSINITIEDANNTADMIVVRAERKPYKTDSDNGAEYSRVERHIGRFYRSFQLSELADLDNLDAEYKDGILFITVPKKTPPEPKRRTINIK